MTLAELRKKRRMTQMDLAKVVDVHVRLISRWESGEGEPSLRNAMYLAQALGVTLDDIAGCLYVPVEQPSPPAIIAEALRNG